jgi:1,5-anhydro-D-fructose reductase (1,5-anhydro-D-mannitol-forming)
VLLTDADGTREIAVPDRRHTYDITLEAFAGAVQGGGTPIVSGEDAYNTLAVSVAILESARNGARARVDFLAGPVHTPNS